MLPNVAHAIAEAQVFEELINAPDIISDRPLMDHRVIGIKRVFESGGLKTVVQTDCLAWVTFFRKHFDPSWSDKEVLDQLLTSLDGMVPKVSRVIRGRRKEVWECIVHLEMESKAQAHSTATLLRSHKYRAGVCAPKQIVDKVLHDLGALAVFNY